MIKLYRNSVNATANIENRSISGTAIVFNQWSEDLGGFRELIRSGALTQEILDKSDVMANMDHDNAYIMARRKFGKGNLELTLTENGLDFRFDCPETAKGEELLQHVKRGEIDSCSFCFTLPENREGETWYRENGELRREITRFDRIYDVSCVFSPAYSQTSCSARDLEMAKLAAEELDKAEEEARKIEESTVVEEEPKEADKPEETPVVEEPKEEVTEPVEEPKEEPEAVEETVIEEVPETDDKQNDNTRSIEQEK